MKNPHPRATPVARDLPPNLMREIGRVVFYIAYTEWQLNVITHDLLRLTKILGRLATGDIRAIDRFDLVCDLVNLKGIKTNVDLISLRKSIVSAMTQRDLLAHGTWTRDPQTKAFLLRLVRDSWKPQKHKEAQAKRTANPRTPQYGITECRSLSQLINGIMLTVDELHLDALG